MRQIQILVGIVFLIFSANSAVGNEPDAKVMAFLKTNCLDCHEGSSAESGFDLTKLPTEFAKTDVEKWTRIFDRVHEHEMPPADYGEINDEVRNEFLELTKQWLETNQQSEFDSVGRVQGRRLTNLQLERTLQDLLGVDIPLAARMPDEPKVNGFTTVAAGQPMSHFQLEQHVDVVDVALDEAFRRAASRSDDSWRHDFSPEELARRKSQTRCRQPEMVDGLAVTWSGRLPFYGRMHSTAVSKSGWYRVTVRAKAIRPPDRKNGKEPSIWCTMRTGKCIAGAPLLNWGGSFELTKDFSEHTFKIWIHEGHKIEIRPGEANLKRGKFNGGQVGTGIGITQNIAGVGIQLLQMERIHLGPSSEKIRQTLFGVLKTSISDSEKIVVETERPRKDAATLMRQFAQRAFRRPVDAESLKPYQSVVAKAIGKGVTFDEAIRLGYRSLLCSPRFLYFNEKPGKLDDFAIASRLSYFLWNSMPDKRLIQLAANGKLNDSKVVRNQVERMLKDKRAENFVRDLAAQWLDLNLIEFTEPDQRLYPGFDTIVQNSMLDETHAFLEEMLAKNLSVSNLIDSDFTFLNSRLANYYGISNVAGNEIRKVELTKEHKRGGLMTNGAILKVTANGTNTSPVIRGVWISERLLGEEIPPPPANVPAIEPDIRGAKTIREQLAKHKNDTNCASCHVKIDPPGFALENFDPSGRWRSNYAMVKGKKRTDAALVDPSFEFKNGEKFKDLQEFQRLVLNDKSAIAKNVVEKLLTYGTGAPIAFADREEVERCVQQAKNSDYGFRALIHATIQSEIFMSK